MAKKGSKPEASSAMGPIARRLIEDCLGVQVGARRQGRSDV